MFSIRVGLGPSRPTRDVIAERPRLQRKMGKCTVDNRDDYYRRAKEDGYRARSAYKLLHLDRQFNLLNPSKVRRVCDLCAAPGSWSQVLANRLIGASSATTTGSAAKIISVDLQRVAPISGVTVVQGDITAPDTIVEILRHFDGEKADLVLCDGAGELSACVIDEYLQSKLVLTALSIARKIMRPGATFVSKVLVGDSYRDLVERKLSMLFERVETVKPPSSRLASSEHFAVCIGMLGDTRRSSRLGYMETMLLHRGDSSVMEKAGNIVPDEERAKEAESKPTVSPAVTISSKSCISGAFTADRQTSTTASAQQRQNFDRFRRFYSAYANTKLGLPS